MTDTDPFEDEDDDDLFDDELEELRYMVYMPPTKPLNMDKVKSWVNPRTIEVEAAEDEAYVYWNHEMDGVALAFWNSRVGQIAFEHPQLIAWEFVDESVRYKFAQDDDDTFV